MRRDAIVFGMVNGWNRGLVLAGLGLAMLLGGCRKQPETAASAAPDMASAEAMIRKIYAAYATDGGKGIDLSDPAYFTGSLVEQNLAYQKREREYDGEGMIEADPLCQCQDYQGLAVASLAMVPTGAGTLDAKATIQPIKDDPEVSHLTLKLVKTPAGWRIDDVIPDDPTQGLRALYAADIEEDKKLGKPKHK
jgi:hypothetical protein